MASATIFNNEPECREPPESSIGRSYRFLAETEARRNWAGIPEVLKRLGCGRPGPEDRIMHHRTSSIANRPQCCVVLSAQASTPSTLWHKNIGHKLGQNLEVLESRRRTDRHRPDRHCRREICDEKFALIASGLMLVRRDPGTSVVAKCLIGPYWIGSKQYGTGRLLIKSAR
uniref:Uncharacterized protein n=1 Tax=Anopheles merus TaxID=30066 RepID=A0A182UVZ6_ANOME